MIRGRGRLRRAISPGLLRLAAGALIAVSIGAGLRYWAESPESGPEGFGGRFIVTFLFPK